MSDTTQDGGWVIDSQASAPAAAPPTPAEPSGDQSRDTAPTPEPSSPPAEGSAGVQDDTQDDDTSDTPIEGETAEEKAARDEQGRFKRKDPQARINKITFEREQARREAAEARERAAQLEARLAALERGEKPAQPQQATPPPPAGKPSIEQFDSYEAYVEALAEWKADERLTRAEQQRQEREQQARAMSAVQAYTERAKAFAQQVPDFESVVTGSTAPLSAAMREVIVTSPRGPEMAYFLASHPQEAERLTQESAGLDPAVAAPLVRRALEAHLRPPAAESGAAGSTPARSTGPRPITPVGAGPVTAETSPDALPFSPQYVEAMNRKEREERRRRMGA